MNKKQKLILLAGVAMIVASPFIGLLINSLLHLFVCTLHVPRQPSSSQCPTQDFLIWAIIGVFLFSLGASFVVGMLAAKKPKKGNLAKPLFTIPWTKRLTTPVTGPGLRRLVKHAVVVVIVSGVATAVNILPFTYAVVRCGRLPVESSTFMADYSYRLPSDRGYGIHIFSEYRYCTQHDIVATNGYHRNVFTDAATAESEANRLKWEQETKFDPMRINYQVYLPKLEGFEVTDLRLDQMSQKDMQTFFDFKKSASLEGFNFREGKVPNDYELCRSIRYTCEDIGRDDRGNVIKKQTANTTVGYGLTIGDTFIVIGQGGSTHYSDEQMIALINSLIPYSK